MLASPLSRPGCGPSPAPSPAASIPSSAPFTPRSVEIDSGAASRRRRCILRSGESSGCRRCRHRRLPGKSRSRCSRRQALRSPACHTRARNRATQRRDGNQFAHGRRRSPSRELAQAKQVPIVPHEADSVARVHGTARESQSCRKHRLCKPGTQPVSNRSVLAARRVVKSRRSPGPAVSARSVATVRPQLSVVAQGHKGWRQ